MQKEEWKEVDNYVGYYEVSNTGRVRSLDRMVALHKTKGEKRFCGGRILVPAKNTSGYPMVGLCKFGKLKATVVHRLVAEAFLKNDLQKKYVNHKNGIKHDNRLKNLEWCTGSENSLHAYKTGLSKERSGSNNPNSKLTDQTVLKIRNMSKNGIKNKVLAKQFSIVPSHISSIVSMKSWKKLI